MVIRPLRRKLKSHLPVPIGDIHFDAVEFTR